MNKVVKQQDKKDKESKKNIFFTSEMIMDMVNKVITQSKLMNDTYLKTIEEYNRTRRWMLLYLIVLNVLVLIVLFLQTKS